jgi:3-dehydroquinate dehydratase
LATIKLGGYMTYAAPEGGKETAPGQIPVSDIRDMLSRFSAS